MFDATSFINNFPYIGIFTLLILGAIGLHKLHKILRKRVLQEWGGDRVTSLCVGDMKECSEQCSLRIPPRSGN